MNMKKGAISLLVIAITLFAIALVATNRKDLQQEEISSNILDDYDKRAEAEEFILNVKGDALQRAYLTGTTLLYYDPGSLCARVDDELTNHYISQRLIHDSDPSYTAPEEVKELYLNHYYSVLFEYTAEYDPYQFSIVDGEEGQLRVKEEYFVVEKNGVWEICDNQYRGSVPVSEEQEVVK